MFREVLFKAVFFVVLMKKITDTKNHTYMRAKSQCLKLMAIYKYSKMVFVKMHSREILYCGEGERTVWLKAKQLRNTGQK